MNLLKWHMVGLKAMLPKLLCFSMLTNKWHNHSPQMFILWINTYLPQLIKFTCKVKSIEKFGGLYGGLESWCPIMTTHHKTYKGFVFGLETIWAWICWCNRVMKRDQNILAWILPNIMPFGVLLWSILEMCYCFFVYALVDHVCTIL